MGTTSVHKGLLIALSGPSGVGKGTVCAALRKRSTNLVYSVSATTRQPRQGEVDGVHYFFKDRPEFLNMIDQNALLEWATYMGNYYGTPRQFVQETLDSGQDVILEIEVQGALQIKEKFPEGVFIFLTPPSLPELKQRISGRGTETDESIFGRMTVAEQELALIHEYDYAVMNDKVESACDRILSIVQAEHCRVDRLMQGTNEQEGPVR